MAARNENAVSPVVGVMLMLVVTIIIAAVVSAFAGGAISSKDKAPQAEISAKYSIATGMQIYHDGGEAIPTSQLIFTIRDGETFGSSLDQLTSQLIDKTVIYNSENQPMIASDGGYSFSSFNPGDTLYIHAEDTSCVNFQTGIAPDATKPAKWDGYTYIGGSKKAPLWALCIRNDDNIGKSFILEVTDTKGNMISKTNVVIAP